MIIASITLGLVFGLVTLGTWLTSHIIKFDDLTVEGSFCAGAACTAFMITANWSPLVASACALLVGIGAGCATALLRNGLDMNPLLAGILSTNILFALSLACVGANLPLTHLPIVFDVFANNAPAWIGQLTVLVICAGSASACMHWFLSTQIGLLVHTVGDNRALLAQLGKRASVFETIALAISNGLAGLAGALFVQLVGFFSIWSSVGVLICALAGFLLGQILTPGVLGLIAGSIALQLITTITLQLNAPPELNRLVSAGIIIVVMLISGKKRPW